MLWGIVQDYWLPTPLACFPFTSPTVRHRVPSGFNWPLATKDQRPTQLLASSNSERNKVLRWQRSFLIDLRIGCKNSFIWNECVNSRALTNRNVNTTSRNILLRLLTTRTHWRHSKKNTWQLPSSNMWYRAHWYTVATLVSNEALSVGQPTGAHSPQESDYYSHRWHNLESQYTRSWLTHFCAKKKIHTVSKESNSEIKFFEF